MYAARRRQKSVRGKFQFGKLCIGQQFQFFDNTLRQLPQGGFIRHQVTLHQPQFVDKPQPGAGVVEHHQHKEMCEIRLPNTLKYIGKEAFWGCRRLEKVELPNSLEKLGNYCFFKTGLKRITIPGGVKRITQMCFGDCGLLNEVGLEDGIECIGANLLTRVNGLNKKISTSCDGVLPVFPCILRESLCFVRESLATECGSCAII